MSAVVNHCQHKDFVCCILIKNVMMEAVERKPANIVKMYDASVREASEEAERPLEFSVELHAQANPLLIVIVNRGRLRPLDGDYTLACFACSRASILARA